MNIALEQIKEIRQKVMYEVAELALNDRMEEIDRLAEKIAEQIGDNSQKDWIVQEINLVLGLDPSSKQEKTPSQYLEQAYTEKGQSLPIISAIPSLCKKCGTENSCVKACPSEAIAFNDQGERTVDADKCTACSVCLDTCPASALADKVQFLPLLKLLKDKKHPVYAEVAPAIAGQFGEKVTLGQLRSALKKLGFIDMIEVALFADLLSIKEAYEFDHFVKNEKDFMLTSCCCPVWITTIQKKFPQLLDKVSPSVSPMIATARILKKINPEVKTVFIGPCAAKKKEALQEDVKGEVDFVLTFKEMATIFSAAELDLAKMPDDYVHQASWGGRAYGRTGGVSASIELIMETIAPQRAIKVNSKRVDGAKACQEILEKALQGNLDVNFIEGMGCKGGCIGGPGRIMEDLFEGTRRINEYAYEAKMKIPINNPDVYAVLRSLGMNDKIPKIINTNPLQSLLSRDLQNTKKEEK